MYDLINVEGIECRNVTLNFIRAKGVAGVFFNLIILAVSVLIEDSFVQAFNEFIVHVIYLSPLNIVVRVANVWMLQNFFHAH